MADILLAPYLPASREMRVGPWRLVSFGALDDSGVVPDNLTRPVARFVDAYRLPPGSGQPMGVVAVPNGGQVGAPFDRSAIHRLGHALLAGAFAGNPPMVVPEDEEEPNSGWAVATSENALLYGHPLTGGKSYAIETGVLAKVTAVRHAQRDDPLPSIAPPPDSPRPMFASFDDEIAEAVLAALCTGQAPARRLERALDWYRIALSNAEAVSLDVRVGAARSALEILTEAGDATRRLVRAYGQLVREDSTMTATYTDVFWASGPVQLTPDEWWMTRLCELRNAIVHGDRVPAELWEHEGHHQTNEIHDRLISALRIVVADETGDPVLRLRKSDRVFARMAEHVAAHLHRQASESVDDSTDSAGEASEGEPAGWCRFFVLDIDRGAGVVRMCWLGRGYDRSRAAGCERAVATSWVDRGKAVSSVYAHERRGGNRTGGCRWWDAGSDG